MNPPKVKEIMTEDVAYVTIPGNRDEVLKTLQKRQVSGVPVLKDGRVAGMITRSDLLRHKEEDQTALIMTRNPVTIGPESTVLDAAELLKKHWIRRLPVVDDGRLVGMVTVADIVQVAAEMDMKTPIADYFETGIVTLWSETPLPVAGAIMELAEVGACPVLDSNAKLIGIVSDRDLIDASVIVDSTAKTDLSAASEDDAWMWDRFRQTKDLYYGVSRIELRGITVREAMVPAITALRTTTVSESAALMRNKKIDQLPVVTPGQKLAGLIRDRDLIKAMVHHFRGQGPD